MNYPVIEVSFERNATSTTFKFEQDRFYLSIEDEEFSPIYTSPFKYRKFLKSLQKSYFLL